MPEDRVSELFGFYSLSGRAAAILGPLVWGVVILLLKPFGEVIKYKTAIFSLIIFIVIGLLILIKIPEKGYRSIKHSS
ncbi:hypothetical protein ACFL4T_11610 [candidate division KSB1 bacterium]